MSHETGPTGVRIKITTRFCSNSIEIIRWGSRRNATSRKRAFALDIRILVKRRYTALSWRANSCSFNHFDRFFMPISRIIISRIISHCTRPLLPFIPRNSEKRKKKKKGYRISGKRKNWATVTVKCEIWHLLDDESGDGDGNYRLDVFVCIREK